MKLKIAVCDDYIKDIDALANMIISYFEHKRLEYPNIKKYTSSIDLIKAYSRGLFNIIFLDVYMPEQDGFATAKLLRDIDMKFDLVFVTNAHDKFRICFPYNPKGYLCKEVKQEDINELLDRLLDERRFVEELGIYWAKLKSDEDGLNKRMPLPLMDIIYFRSNKHYITATMQDGASYEFRKKLSSVEDDLSNKGFLRIDQSTLVNVRHIFGVFGSYLQLHNDENLYIAPKYLSTIRCACEGAW